MSYLYFLSCILLILVPFLKQRIQLIQNIIMEVHDYDIKEALELMKCKLPEYIINCLVAAGYDTLPVISKLDNESIHEMESFIAETFPDDSNYMHSSSTPNRRFPPGHLKKLKMFIEEIPSSRPSLKKSAQKQKRPVAMSAPAPKKTCSISDEQCNDLISIKETVSCARRCVAKWQRGQSDSKVKKLEENVDFEILIGSKLNQMILCKLCRKSFTLAYKNGNLLVSNWSRHITQCVKSTKINRQQVLCFSSRSSSESSLLPTPASSPDRISINLTTDDSVSYCCGSLELTHEDTDLGHSLTKTSHSVSTIPKDKSPLPLEVEHSEGLNAFLSQSELCNAQQPSNDISTFFKTQQLSNDSLEEQSAKETAVIIEQQQGFDSAGTIPTERSPLSLEVKHSEDLNAFLSQSAPCNAQQPSSDTSTFLKTQQLPSDSLEEQSAKETVVIEQQQVFDSAATIPIEQSPLSLEVKHSEDLNAFSSQSELCNAQQASNDTSTFFKTQQLLNDSLEQSAKETAVIEQQQVFRLPPPVKQ